MTPSRPTAEEVDRSLEFAEKHASIETTDDEIENILAAEVRVLRQEQAEQHRNCVHRHELEKVKAERDAMREAIVKAQELIEHHGQHNRENVEGELIQNCDDCGGAYPCGDGCLYCKWNDRVAALRPADQEKGR